MFRPAPMLYLVLGLAPSLWGTVADACPLPQRLAQNEIRIPSEIDLDRMNRQDMQIMPPEPDPGVTGSIDSQIQGMDRQDREIDERVLRGICRGCD